MNEMKSLMLVLERRVQPEWAQQILLLHPVYQMATMVNMHDCCKSLGNTVALIAGEHFKDYAVMHIQGNRQAFLDELLWFCDQVHKIEDQVSAEMKLEMGAARKETTDFLQKLRSKAL